MFSQNKIYSIGDTFTYSFELNVSNTAGGGSAIFSIPAEFNIVGDSVPTGSYAPYVVQPGDDPSNLHQAPRKSYKWEVFQNGTFRIHVDVELTSSPSNPNTFTFAATKLDGSDTILTNNSLIETIVYSEAAPVAQGGTNPSFGGGGFINVSTNDTIVLTNGYTYEWRLNTNDVVGGSANSWDVSTGTGYFSYENPMNNITFTYDLYAVSGGQEILISQNEEGTIYKLTEGLDWANHTEHVDVVGNLSQSEIADLQAIYPSLTTDDVIEYLRNSQGVITSFTVKQVSEDFVGTLCEPDGTVVFVWTDGPGLTYTKADKTDFLGDVLTLQDCCCGGSTGDEEGEAEALSPKLTLSLSITPITMSGETPVRGIVNVHETSGNPTISGQDIRVILIKPPYLNFPWEPSATTIGGSSVNNSDWNITDEGGYWAFTRTTPMAGNETSTFGFVGTFDSGGQEGALNVVAILQEGSGGDVSNTNNNDTETINYS